MVRTPAGFDSPYRPEELSLMPGVLESLEALDRAGYLLFVVSNQPGAAKGTCAQDDLEAVHRAFQRLLGGGSALIREFFYCHHHPEAAVERLRRRCECRKPGNLFLRAAREKYGLDLSASWMVGDRDVDVLCGRSLGLKTVLIEYPHTSQYRDGARPDYRCADIREAADAIRFMPSAIDVASK